MLTYSPGVMRAVRRLTVTVSALTLVVVPCTLLHAQIWQNQRSVGGISIDASGFLDNATVVDQTKLSQLRAQAAENIPGELNGWTELRKVSLRGLEAAIQQCLKDGKDLSDEIRYLAGLQQIRYIFVYPQQRDIVLVGPGEGWKVDKQGNIVGAVNGRPVMLLDDLLVALRTARQAAQGGISCSIDPTAEGLARLQRFRPRAGSNPYQVGATIEEVLGPQRISVTGVPPTSHFARVLVAADYRMKRLGMGFEPSPVDGLRSYVSMIKLSGRAMSGLGPRWWLEPNYEPLLRTADGLAWELRGGSVKAMTEQDFLTATGVQRGTGKANPAAQEWAENMTQKYDELAVAEPIFGQLRNCMELAIVGALVVKEQLTEKAGYSMPLLLDPAEVEIEKYFAPKQVDSKASLLKRGSNWVISASGGVQVNSWNVADKVSQSDAPAGVRTKAAPGGNTNWWWN